MEGWWLEVNEGRDCSMYRNHIVLLTWIGDFERERIIIGDALLPSSKVGTEKDKVLERSNFLHLSFSFSSYQRLWGLRVRMAAAGAGWFQQMEYGMVLDRLGLVWNCYYHYHQDSDQQA